MIGLGLGLGCRARIGLKVELQGRRERGVF